MLLVPLQYFLGIVCFLSKTLLTNSPVCLKSRGHLSTCCGNSHSPLLRSDSLRHRAHVPIFTSFAVFILCRAAQRRWCSVTEVPYCDVLHIKQAVYSLNCWVMLFELFKAYILVWTKWRLKHALEKCTDFCIYVYSIGQRILFISVALFWILSFHFNKVIILIYDTINNVSCLHSYKILCLE